MLELAFIQGKRQCKMPHYSSYNARTGIYSILDSIFFSNLNQTISLNHLIFDFNHQAAPLQLHNRKRKRILTS